MKKNAYYINEKDEKVKKKKKNIENTLLNITGYFFYFL